MAIVGKETVLLYNMQGSSKGKMIKLICMQLGIRVRDVEKSQYCKPIGELAGLKEAATTDQSYDGEGFSDEMLIMCGLSSNRIDTLLKSFHRRKLPRIDLKAMVTEHNKGWNSLQLYEELCKEHAQMHPQNSQN